MKLDAYFTIPPIPSGPGIHYIWPGLEPSAENYVFQDVVGDQLGSGTWSFAEWIVNSK